MKKKLLAWLLCAALIVGVAGCGKDDKEDPVTLDAAGATQTIGSYVSAFKAKKKATATFRCDEEVFTDKGETPTSRYLSEVKFFYDVDASKYAMTSAYDGYGEEETPKELTLPVYCLFYCALEDSAYTMYDIRLNDDGTVSPSRSDKATVTKDVVAANMYSFGGNWIDYEVSMMQLAAMASVDLSGAVLDNGVVTFDKDVEGSRILDEIHYTSKPVTYHISLRMDKTGAGEFVLTAEFSDEDGRYKTTLSAKFEDGAEMPTADLTAVTHTTEYDVTDFANMMGELTEMYGTVTVTDGTIVNKQSYMRLDTGFIRMLQTDKATVYYRNTGEPGASTKTYFDFTDLDKQDVYYDEQVSQDAEDIGTFLGGGAWGMLISDTRLTYAADTVTFTGTDYTIVLRLNPFGIIQTVELKHGNETLTETYSYAYEIPVPENDYFEHFTLKTK